MVQELPQAFEEWHFTDRVAEDEEILATCGLCGKEGLRYQFEICNRHTQNILWVGRKCIVRFIPVYDEKGKPLDRRGVQRKLDDVTRKRQYESCVKMLECAIQKETLFRGTLYDALDCCRKYKRLTPNRARAVFLRLKEHKIEHIRKFFKVCLKSNSDKDELRKMSERDRQMLWPALSASQRRQVGSS
jgi:hypothetical protein